MPSRPLRSRPQIARRRRNHCPLKMAKHSRLKHPRRGRTTWTRRDKSCARNWTLRNRAGCPRRNNAMREDAISPNFCERPAFKRFAVVLIFAVATFSQAGAAQPAAVVPGITESFLEVALSSSVAGIIVNQPHKEGDFVKGGDPVVELDRKLEELEVERRKLIVD